MSLYCIRVFRCLLHCISPKIERKCIVVGQPCLTPPNAGHTTPIEYTLDTHTHMLVCRRTSSPPALKASVPVLARTQCDRAGTQGGCCLQRTTPNSNWERSYMHLCVGGGARGAMGNPGAMDRAVVVHRRLQRRQHRGPKYPAAHSPNRRAGGTRGACQRRSSE